MQTGTASILAAGTTLTATLAEINTVVDGKSVETTISDTDAAYPTSGAVVDYVAAQIAPLGGLEVIANEDSFPTIPASGVVISIADAGGIVVNGSGVSTTARTAGNGSDNVTINGFPSSLYSTTLTDNMGLMVSSTGSSNTYTYHKLLGKEDDIKQLSDDINDFAARYRVASSAPSSSLDNGDLWYDTANAKMMVYSSTNSAWEEVTSTGDFYINTISSYSGTGGNNATFNGTAYRFVLSNPPSSAQQLIVSVNGVIQKPNSGTGQPSEGFALNGSSIVFSAAPATGADYFIITVGSTVAIGTPSDNTVSTAKIQNLAVTTAKIAADAVDGTKIADDAVGAEHIEVLDANLQFGDNVNAQFGDDNDLVIKHSGSNANIENITGDLVIRTVGSGDDIFIDSVDDINIRVHSTDDAIKCIGDGAVELYHNNTKKFETTSSGVLMPDNAKLGLGAHSGGEGDLNIWHNGSGNFIDTKWNLSIRKDDGAETLANFNNNGAVELYYDNSKKLNTESWGVEITGTIRADDFTAQDGHKFKFGNDNDLEIYHSGSHSYIKDTGTGELIIQGSGVNIYDGNNKSLFYGVTDGYAAIYYNNSKKLETNAGGVDVTGVMQCDGITLLDNEQFQCGTNVDLRIYHNSSNNNTYIKESGSGILSVNTNQFQLTNAADTEVIINAVENGNVALYYDNSKKFETNTAGVKVTGQLEISSHAAWPDHSSGYVGKAVFGSGDDLQIFHQNGYNYIYGSTPVYVQSNTVELQSQGGEKYVTCVNDGAVSLYYDNSKKFETGPGGTKFFNESIWGNAGNTDPWTATGDVTQGVLLYSEDVNVKFPISANSNDTIACILNRTNGNGGILEFKYNASVVGTISSNGSSLPSDRNFKTNISDLNLGLSLVNKLKPSQFNYKIDDPNTPVMYGLIAQELEETLTSEGVTKNRTQLIQHHPTDDTESDYDVDYSKLIPILINSIKELSAKIETLETKVAALEAK